MKRYVAKAGVDLPAEWRRVSTDAEEGRIVDYVQTGDGWTLAVPSVLFHALYEPAPESPTCRDVCIDLVERYSVGEAVTEQLIDKAWAALAALDKERDG